MDDQPPARPFFDALDDETRDTLEKISHRLHYGAGDVILKKGDAGRDVYVLLSGQCDVAIGDDIVNRIGPGQLFGEIGALGDGVRTATIRATGRCEVLRIAADGLRRVMRQSPRILNSFLKTLARRAQKISERETESRAEHRELQDVQRELLPGADVFRGSRKFSLETHWEPLTFASGDYCDVCELGPERYLAAIGDVMGHGARTAPTLATVRGQLRELAESGCSPVEMLTRLDEHLTEHGPRAIHTTLVVSVLDGDTMTLRLGSAGHPVPALYRDGTVEPLSVTPSPPLGYGLGREVGYKESECTLRSGDKILFFTDGLSEARCGPEAQRDLLGEDGLHEMFRDICRNVPRNVLGPLFTALDGFRRAYPVEDDATALLIHVQR